MFGLGFGHLLLLAAIGLIVLGPEQMTELAKVLGRTIAELKKAMREITSTVSLDPDEDERKRSQYMKEAAHPPTVVMTPPPLPEVNNPPLPPVPAHHANDDLARSFAEKPLASPLISSDLAAQMKFELKPETPTVETTANEPVTLSDAKKEHS